MSGRVLSEEAIREWEQVAMEGGSCTAEGIEWFITTIRDRDKTIAELNERIDELGEVGLQNDELKRRLKELRERLSNANPKYFDADEQNARMLSALEQIQFTLHGCPSCGAWSTEGHRENCLIGQTIAQVKGGDS